MTVNGTGVPMIDPAAFANVIVPVHDGVGAVVVVDVDVVTVVVGITVVTQRLQMPTGEIPK